MCKSLFTFDVIKASLLLFLVHGVVANRLAIFVELYQLEITYSGTILMVK